MGLFSFFKPHRVRQFEYKPLFYDQDKEDFHERVKRIEEEMGIHKNSGNTSVSYRPGIKKGTMRSYLKTEKRKDRFSSLRLIIILLLLMAIAYYFIMK